MNRRLRRHHAHRVRASWRRFLLDMDRGCSWHPYRGWSRGSLRWCVAHLASGKISWRGSDTWWKAYQRRLRERQEADDLREARAELDAGDDGTDPRAR